MLKSYEEVLPGAAERIFKMAEQQGEHRQRLEAANLSSEITRANRGQLYGFIIAIVVILIGGGLLLAGKDLLGFAAILSALAALAGVFVAGTITRKRERERKFAASEPPRKKAR